jgi:IS1 family transposase
MRSGSTRSSWALPPATREIQLDEKWSFVGKKQERLDLDKPADRDLGERWDHTAFDAEHALLLTLVVGKRTEANCKAVVADVKQRTGGRTDVLLTSDEYRPYAIAIKHVYGVMTSKPRRGSAGRAPKPRRLVPTELCYATVKKTRKRGRVVRVEREIVYGSQSVLSERLARSLVSKSINTSYVERNNATDRGKNARKRRKTYCFSRCIELHDAVTYFTTFSYNFCWPVRTLRTRFPQHEGPTTPAMAAGLADHVWSLGEWASFPSGGLR